MGCSSSTSVSAIVQRYEAKEGVSLEELGLMLGQHALKDFHKYFTFEGMLGKGSFAQVYLAHHATSGKHVAVKVLDLNPDAEKRKTSEKKTRQAQKEVSVMLKVTQHPHCVRCFNCFCDDWLMFIVMEHCQSTFHQALRGLPDVKETTYAASFRQIFLALEYIHSKNVVHRDVKPDNFLCSPAKSGLCLKLGDFGLAEVLPAMSSAFPLKGSHGTAPYMSPEMINHEGYGFGTDVWSAGVAAYVLLLGGFPYKPSGPSAEDMRSAIAVAALEPTFKPGPCVDSSGQMRISQAGERFLREALKRDRSARPSSAKALAHEWLQPWVPNGPEPSLRKALYGAQRVGAFNVRTPRAGSQEASADPLEGAEPLRRAARAQTYPSRVSQKLAPSRAPMVHIKEPASDHPNDGTQTQSTAADLPQAMDTDASLSSTSCASPNFPLKSDRSSYRPSLPVDAHWRPSAVPRLHLS